ncbi:patatin-like phospholipase family protein [bacterium]|nr:patatin-like phospholipase family protein [bacterium]RQV94339.1 MAG: hypothetical protein EH221_07775 [bacterium]
MKKSCLLILILGFFILFPLKIRAQSSRIEIPLDLDRTQPKKDSFISYYQFKRPKITLALSGGGARGLAQIGVLKVFERHGLPIDGIAGTSMGAIVGGLFAVGYSAAEIESLAYQIRWNEIIQDAPLRDQLFLSQKEEKERYILQLRLKGLSPEIPSAYTSGQKLTTLLTELIMNSPYSCSSNFDYLRIPFRALATDLLTGEGVVLREGSLIDALRASMAIPLLFTPVEMNDAMLVDGGLIQNLPVSEAKTLGGDLVIAIDTSSKLRNPGALNAPWEIADQVTTIMQNNRVRSEMDQADVAIQPLLEDISNTDFDDIKAIIQSGEKAAEEAIPMIEQFLSWKSNLQSDLLYRIKEIAISGCRYLDSDPLISNMNIDTSYAIPEEQILWAGHTLLQTGYFHDISTFVDTLTDRLVFLVNENPMIHEIAFSGNHILSDSALYACMSIRPGEVLNIQKGRRDRIQIIEKYRTAGYSLADIDTVIMDEGVLNIIINEGEIGRINLHGNDHTHSFVIDRELPFKSGDLMNISLLKQGIENIYSTGYFESVRLNVERKGQNWDLNLHLVEQRNTLLRLGLRYDLERRSQGLLEIIRENLLGFGGKGSLTGLLGKRDELLQARFWSDRLYNTYMTFNFNFSMQKRQFDYYENHQIEGNYTQSITEGSLAFGQQMRRLGTLSLRIKIEDIDLKPNSGFNTPREKFTLFNIILRSEVDTRDRMPFPHAGKYHILEYESAYQFLGSAIAYFKIFSSMESYYAISPSVIFHPRIRWGTSDLTIPFVKQFRVGGMDSFSGVCENTFIGKRFFVIDGELSFQLPWPKWLESYLSIRYHFGGIWTDYTKIKTSDFKQGIGLILSVNTPLGPIQTGYGHMSDGYNQFYFSAGYRF